MKKFWSGPGGGIITVCTGDKVTLYHPNLLALVWVKLTYFTDKYK